MADDADILSRMSRLLPRRFFALVPIPELGLTEVGTGARDSDTHELVGDSDTHELVGDSDTNELVRERLKARGRWVSGRPGKMGVWKPWKPGADGCLKGMARG